MTDDMMFQIFRQLHSTILHWKKLNSDIWHLSILLLFSDYYLSIW